MTQQVGVTGTRNGATPNQLARLEQRLGVLSRNGHLTVHHGDCVGVDAQAHAIALQLGARIHIHPPTDETHRAWCEGAAFVHSPLGHLARNRLIVSSVGELIAVPVSPDEIDDTKWRPGQGGTVYTVKRAVAVGVPCLIIYPTESPCTEPMVYANLDEITDPALRARIRAVAESVDLSDTAPTVTTCREEETP